MLDAIRDEIKRHRRHFDRPLHVGVFKLGGHGDFMQQVAFARAVRHKWPAKQATLTLLSRFDANGVNDHILQGASFVDSCIQVPTGDWRHMVQELSPAFDVFYDVQYVAGVYYRDKQRFAAQQLDANTRLARYAREEINDLGDYYAFSKELVNGDSIFDFDETKLSVNTLDVGLAGIEVYDLLRDKYDIQVEFGDLGNILAYLSVGDKTKHIERLISALSDIRRLHKRERKGLWESEYLSPEVVFSPQTAFYAKKESLPLLSCAGGVSAEFVMSYPPGIPILAPGERITPQIIEYIRYAKEKGCTLTGPEAMDIARLNIVSEVADHG